jgi:hypothetical protein
MTSYLKYKLKEAPIQNIAEKKSEIIKEKNVSFFFPKEKDSLFWCYFIILNGDTEYEMLNVKNILVEKSNKFEYINKIRGNKQTIKTYKLDTLTNIESNLANDEFINIKTVISLCCIDRINIVYISKKTYFELLMNDDKPIYIIKEIESQSKYKKRYGYQTGDISTLDEIRKTYYKIDTIDKPMRALSYYKVSDLIEICNKLAIEVINKTTGKSKTKNELYELIIQYF